MAKHLVGLDEDALRLARAELQTQTIKDTVNDLIASVTGQPTTWVVPRGSVD